MRFDIRRKITIFTLAPILIIFILGFSIITTHNFNNSKLDLEQHYSENINLYAQQFDSKLKQISLIAESTADYLEISQSFSEDQLFRILSSNLDKDNAIYGAAIAFEPFQFSPQIKLFSPYVYRGQNKIEQLDIGSEGYDYTMPEWEWWNGPRNTLKPVWTDVYFDEGAGNVLMSTYSVPFIKDNQFWGVTTVDIQLEILNDIFAAHQSNDMTFMIISQKGAFLYHSNPNRIMSENFIEIAEQSESKDFKELANNITNGESGFSTISGWGTPKKKWVFNAPITETNWSLIASIPEDAVFSSLYVQMYETILFFVVTILLILLSVIYVSHKIAKPLRILNTVALEYSKGNWDANINVQSSDEIGDLAYSFNQMAKQLSNREALLLETEARNFRDLLDSAPDGMVVVNQNGSILTVNNQATIMFDYEKDELIGQPVEILLPELLRIQHVNLVQGFFRDPSARQMGSDRKLYAQKKDGTEFPVDVSLSPVAGKELRVIAGIRDITERLQREYLIRLNSKVGDILTQSINIDDNLQQCAEAMIEFLNASLIRFWVIDNSSGVLEMKASAGLYTHIDGSHSRVKVGERKVGKIAEMGESYISNDIANDPLIDDQEWARKHGLKGFVGIPLKVGNRLVGMMVKFATHDILPYRLKTLESIAQNIAIAIDRNNSQQSSLESKERLDLALQSSGIGIWEWDIVNDVVTIDDTLKEISGLKNVGQESKEEASFLKLIHPDDIDRVKESTHRTLIQQGEEELEYRLVRKDNQNVHISSRRKYFLDEHGTPTRLIGVCRDITEHKLVEQKIIESQQFLQGLIDNSIALVYAKNLDGIYTLVNKKWCEVLGIAKENIIGKTDYEIFPPENAEEFRRNDLKVIETGEPIQKEESVTVNGEQRTYMSLKFPIIDSQGKPNALCGMSSDISNLKELQDELQSKLDELNRFRKFAVGRELKMVELKKEINEYLMRNGLDEKYKIVNESKSNLHSEILDTYNE